MKPIICFFKNEYIQSDHFTLLEKGIHQSAFEFLKEIEKKYFIELKILQVDFDAFEDQRQIKKRYYRSPIVQVFVIHSYKVITSDQLKTNLTARDLPQFKTDTNKAEFCGNVEKIISDIKNGRFYQVNLTAALSSESPPLDSFQLFKSYFPLFQARYPAFLPNTDFDILCFSPELFLQKCGPQLLSRPIKGTTNQSFDSLLENKKERAELSMIVDLIRNDLHSVATSPAKVNVHREKLQLSYTTHTYSEIEVQTDQTLPMILLNTMPGGSISGCPKKESLKSIAENENYQRQFYTGTIGWWKREDFELNIAIRSFVRTSHQLNYFAGCGIVAESDPVTEWNELLNKAGKLNLILQPD
jgi:para-aminobenzoate synthetase component I